MKKAQTKIIIAAGVLILIVAIIGLLLAVVQVPYTANVVYTEKEPYNVQNCYDEQIKWSSSNPPCTGSFGFPGAGARCFDVKCTINNDDSVGGTFKIQLRLWKSDGITMSSDDYEKEVYINAFSTASPEYSNLFCWPVDTTLTLERMDKNIIPPTKQVCTDATNYKDTEKTKTETRYCSAWNKLIGKC